MRASSVGKRFAMVVRLVACVALLAQTIVAPAQTASGSIDAEWHVASFSGRVSMERVNRSTEEMAEGRNAPMWTGEKIVSMETGQASIQGPDGVQIRIREHVKLRRADSSVWDVESGLAGFRFEPASGDPPVNQIITPWAKVEFRTGIVIVKVAPYLTRVAVLKGTAEVTGQGSVKRTLTAKQECAAVPSAIAEAMGAARKRSSAASSPSR